MPMPAGVLPSPAASALAVRGVSAGYGLGDVLRDVSFDIAVGETFGLIGLNGAGKTTLIKIILGLMPPAAGSVSFFGQSALTEESKAQIAYLPEKFEPPAFLTGMEFVRLSLRLYGRGCNESDVLAAADRIALSRAALDRRVHTYSKGMRQKTGLMGTWLTRCPLLILDEPMSGLDPRARALVKDEIAACRAAGITVFLSSHILADMDEICDCVGVIHDARFMFLGTPEDMRIKTGKDNLERAFLEIIGSSSKVYES